MNYDKIYTESDHIFGSEPEKILIDFADRIDKTKPVLDIGAGQGRNTFFLAENGHKIDAIDPSPVAVETIKNIAQNNSYSINAHQFDFQDYNPSKTYSAILVFGLIQILNWKSINYLINKIDEWTDTGSVIFMTAFSVKDLSYQKYCNEWAEAVKRSFTDGSGEYRTFLEVNEILTLFDNYSILHHWEGLGKKHKHGDGPVEQHSMIELIIQK